MQAICDANLVFQDVVARWPGSHHDLFVLQSSSVYDRFENDEVNDYRFLGNSGYPLNKWLITPFGNPTAADERRFNILPRKTRCAIERSFGVLNLRWRILDRKVCYGPEKVCKIAFTCCVLHYMPSKRYTSSRNGTTQSAK